jgi:hypothetical protein
LTTSGAQPVQLAVVLLHGFLRSLRESGVGATASKQEDFLRALTVSPPSSLEGLYWTARVTLVMTIEDVPVFDAVFDACFRGGRMPITYERAPAPDEEGETAAPTASGDDELEEHEWAEGAGVQASGADMIHRRTFPATSARDHERLLELRAALAQSLPQIHTRRLRRARRGRRLDLRRVLRAAERTGGEVIRLRWREHPRRDRRVLLLIDVSGSLKQHSPDLLRFAHAAIRTSPRVEAFTFGTRLTRVTRAMSVADVDQALAAVAGTVLDADGGTRIGIALEEFLADGRFVAGARGALVIVLSDGLERGDPAAMVRAVERLARLGHRLVWWSPLACDPAYRPVTRAMEAALPSIDHLAGARDLETLIAEVLCLPRACARARRAAARDWSPTVPGGAS